MSRVEPGQRTNALIKYEAACRAVDEARTIDEAKDLADKAEACRIYARKAKNRALEVDCAEIRLRAERQLGALLAHRKASGTLARGGQPYQKPTDSDAGEVARLPTLSDLGVDAKLSSRSQKLAAFDAPAFEQLLEAWRAGIEQRGDKVTLALLREEKRQREMAVATPQRTDTTNDLEALAARVIAGEIPPFACIHADPPWHYETWSDKGAERAPQRHYVTMTIEQLCAMAPTVQALAAPDCALLLWVVDWQLPGAFAVLEAWGFALKTRAFVWIKTNADAGKDESRRYFAGKGKWSRANAEDVWLATRGAPGRRQGATDIRQLIFAPRGRHSEKPVEAALRIERLCDGPYLELFGRRKREGWTVWGNQVPATGKSAAAIEAKMTEGVENSTPSPAP